jgi:nucleoside 2-deoxyribosyltransferase
MKLYFAAPLFTTAERLWNATVVDGVRAAGHEVFLPQENEPGKTASEIFAADVGGIDWADGVVAIMDGPDPDSGTSWEVGYAYAARKPIVLVRTDIRVSAGSAGDYNAMLMQAATTRIDLPGASTDEVTTALIDALARSPAYPLSPQAAPSAAQTNAPRGE